MGDLISGPNGPSVGYGIGLSGKLDNEWLGVAERGMQAAARQRALDAAAALKRQGTTDKANSDLAERSKISGVHPALVGDIQDKHVAFLQALRDHTKSGSSEYAIYDPSVQKPYEDLMAQQSAAVNNTKLYNDFDIKRNPEYLAKNKMELTPEGQELQAEITKSEDDGGRPTERLKELTKNKYGYLNRELLDKTTRPIPLNIPAFSQAFASHIGLDTWKVTNDKGDMFEDKSGKGITEEALTEVLKNNLLTRSPEMNQIIDNYGGKDKDIDLAAKEWAKLMKGYIIRSSATTLRSKPKDQEFLAKGKFSGNTWANDKVRVQYNDINGVKSWDFSNIKSDAENKNLTFNLPGGKTVTGVPTQFVQEDPNSPPVLKVVTPEVKSGGVVVTESKIEDIPYPIAAPKIQNEYGFNPKAIEVGIDPEYGKQRTTKGSNVKDKNFGSLSNDEKVNLQKKSGAKNIGEFKNWLKSQGYTY